MAWDGWRRKRPQTGPEPIPVVPGTRPRYGGRMSPEPRAVYVISCEACGFVGVRRGTDVMACAQVAVRHAGGQCDPTRVIIHPLEVAR